MRIAITGEKGFLGTHLALYFKHVLKYEVIELGKNYLETLSNIKNIDWLIHAAFIHRNPDPEKVLALNRVLTKKTITCLNKNNIDCNIVFLSSIHEDLDTFYGRSKREAKKAFLDHCKQKDKTFISYKLPNIFGKYATPNKTSFIASFCYNIHNNIPVNYNINIINLCFVDDVVSIICKLQEKEIPFTETTVEKVYLLLKRYKKLEQIGEFPNLKSKFEFDLFSTFESYTNYKI